MESRSRSLAATGGVPGGERRRHDVEGRSAEQALLPGWGRGRGGGRCGDVPPDPDKRALWGPYMNL